jgi:CRP-like cAMP-binding protein
MQLMNQFRNLLTDTEEQSLKMARLNVPSKVADALCKMVGAFGTDSSRKLNLELSRQDIADLAGSTKEQVSKIIAEFKAQGLIRTRGKQITIDDLKTLQDLSNG